jgi:hypothetical protein
MTKIEPESIRPQPSTMTMVELERSLVFAMAMPEPDAIRLLQSSTMTTTMGELNTILLQTIVDHWEGGNSVGDYSTFMREYRQHAEAISGLPEDSNVDGAGSSSETAKKAPHLHFPKN